MAKETYTPYAQNISAKRDPQTLLIWQKRPTHLACMAKETYTPFLYGRRDLHTLLTWQRGAKHMRSLATTHLTYIAKGSYTRLLWQTCCVTDELEV